MYIYIITFGLIIYIMAVLFSSVCFNKFISTLVQIICDFKVPQHPDISPFKHICKISKKLLIASSYLSTLSSLSFRPSVGQSLRMEQLGSHRTDFHEI